MSDRVKIRVPIIAPATGQITGYIWLPVDDHGITPAFSTRTEDGVTVVEILDPIPRARPPRRRPWWKVWEIPLTLVGLLALAVLLGWDVR